MKKLVVSVMLLVLYCLGLPSVLAKEATVISLPEEGYYFERIGPNHYHSARFHKYSFNGEAAYCIEPGVGITEEIYEEHAGLEAGPFDEEIMKKIELIGYYGYGYPGHDTIRYRIATQELIWTSVSDYTFQWNDQKNGIGNPIDLSYEKNEIMALVNRHYEKPSFDTLTLEGERGKQIILTDDNYVLDQYEVMGPKNTNVSIRGNQLSINLEEDDTQIQLVKRKWSNKTSFIYTNSGQTMAIFGLSEPVISTVNLSILKSKVRVQKIDAETNDPILQEGIRFKIKNLDTNSYVCSNLDDTCEYITSSNGSFITPFFLEAGTYQLEEVDQKIEGYLWNSEPVVFTIQSDSDFIEENNEKILEVPFANHPVKGNIELEKIGEKIVFQDNSYFYEETFLDDVSYQLYAANDILKSDGTILYAKDTLLGTYQTILGQLKIKNLPLGQYYLIEISSVANHIVDNQKLYVDLVYQGQYTNVVVKIQHKNYLKKGKMEFIKTDIETGQPLPNTTIQIFDETTNQMIYEGITNDEGKIQLDNLYVGKFYILEKQPPQNYELYLDKVFFEIHENGEEVHTSMTNHPIVEVPATFANKSFYGFSFIFILIGITGILYEKKKL